MTHHHHRFLGTFEFAEHTKEYIIEESYTFSPDGKVTHAWHDNVCTGGPNTFHSGSITGTWTVEEHKSDEESGQHSVVKLVLPTGQRPAGTETMKLGHDGMIPQLEGDNWEFKRHF